MTRAYLRLDPELDERLADFSDGMFRAYVETLCHAEDQQPRRGRFRSARLLRVLLGKRARFVSKLIDEGALIEQENGSLYVDSWDEWQEGDLKVADRMSLVREKRAENAPLTGAERTARWRQKQRDAEAKRSGRDVTTPPSGDVTVTTDGDVTRGRARGRAAEAVSGGISSGGGRPSRRPTNGSIDPERPTTTKSAQEILDDPTSSAEAKAGAQAWLDLRGNLPKGPTRVDRKPVRALDFG